MEAHICNHPKVPHTVIYSIGKGDVVRECADLEAADIFAQKIIRQNSARLTGLKIYRSDNESYVCFSWPIGGRTDMVETQKVKLEVDMEPLHGAFENVALGFKEQNKAIRRVWIVQGAVIVGFTIDILVRMH